MTTSTVFTDRSARGDRRLGRIAEIVVVLLLLTELIAQVMTYPPTYADDPDGYVTYAKHIIATQALLPGYPRLPGYPAFLALVSNLSPDPLPDNVWWVQGAMMLVLAVVAWAFTRRWFGPLTAVVLLGILAAPNFLVRMSIVMLTDMLYTVLVLPVFMAMGWWALRTRSRASWLWCLLFVLVLFLSQTVRPTTFLLTFLFGPALIVGYLAERGLRNRAGLLRDLRPVLARSVAIMALGFVVFFIVDMYLDTGAREFNSNVIAYRVSMALPAVGDTRADRRIERAKANFEKTEGQPIWSSHFLTYRNFKVWQALRADDVQSVWQERLKHYPGLYLLSVLQDFKLNHYYMAMRFTPIFLDLGRVNLFGEYFTPVDDSPTSRIFHSTGILIFVMPDAKAVNVNAELMVAVAKLVSFWGLLIVGCWQLARRSRGLTVAFILLATSFTGLVAATNTLDGRYLLPFALFIYLAEAMAITWIAQGLMRWPASRPVTVAPPVVEEIAPPARPEPEPEPALSR